MFSHVMRSDFGGVRVLTEVGTERFELYFQLAHIEVIFVKVTHRLKLSFEFYLLAIWGFQVMMAFLLL